MPNLIRPKRLAVTDRFPMVGFTIRTDRQPRRYEVAVASDAALFRGEAKGRRTASNFYSTRGGGPLAITNGEGVYILPPEVLARFVGQPRLYYALATYENGKGVAQVEGMPSDASPYIDLRGLTGRSLRRVKLLPSRQRAAAQPYRNGSNRELEWAGDTVQPGMQPVGARSGNGAPVTAAPPTQVQSLDYDDGFGPLPTPPRPSPRRTGQTRAAAPAMALSSDIPLDPGTGGQSIGPDSLEAGDIILSTTSDFVSKAIRLGSRSDVSHAMVYVGQGGQVVEAIGSGVVMRSLEEALGNATVAVAFRAPDLDETGRLVVADKVAAYIGKSYDFYGVFNQARFQVHSTVCDLLPDGAKDLCRTGWRIVDLGSDHNDRFFCSEMILAAYDAAGVPLTTTPPHWNSPEDLAQLSFKAGVLQYVGHLKAPPLTRSQSLGARSLATADDPATQQALQDARDMGASEEDIQQLLALMGTGEASAAPAAAALESAVAVKGSPRPFKFPSVSALPEHIGWWGLVAPIAVTNPTVAATMLACRTAANKYHVSIGIGPKFDIEVVTGLSAGVGVIFAPGNVVGVYGEVGLATGVLAGVEGTLSMTIVEGGLEEFKGIDFAVGIMGGEGIVGGAEVLLDPHYVVKGISGEVGLGVGSPVQFYFAIKGSLAVGGELAVAAGAESATAPNGNLRLPPPPPPVRRVAQAASAEIVGAIVGAVVERILNNVGDVTWDLEQLKGVKHPQDKAAESPAQFHNAPVIAVKDWPYVQNALGDRLGASFKVEWQYNGTSVGNVRITHVGTNDAAGSALHVEARIMDDQIVYPEDAPRFAAIWVRFHYRFSRFAGRDAVALVNLHLYGDGTYEQSGEWTQFSAL
jgi:hypothetical protein